MSFFSNVPLSQRDPILGLSLSFKEDPRYEKVNLGVGVYCNEELKTPILSSVQEATKRCLAEERSKEYLPICGDPLFCHEMGKLFFGNELWMKDQERVALFQSLGGTGALALGAKLLQHEAPGSVFLPIPTWANHAGIFRDAGLDCKTYPYYDSSIHGVNFDKMMGVVGVLKKDSILLLHACCHNPTGSDLNEAMWKEVALVCQKRGLLVFLDCAYLGLGTSFKDDRVALRVFLEAGVSFLVAASCSKNFSLYGERVGALFVVTENPKETACVTSRVSQLIRTSYSNPPRHGAGIVTRILTDGSLHSLWESEVETMRQRIVRVRSEFSNKLSDRTGFSFDFLKKSSGMFAFCGLTSQETEFLQKKYGIYMTRDGRVNVCGLNDHNIDHVVAAISEAVGQR